MKIELKPRHVLKFLSVFMAVILWVYVVNSAQIEIDKIVKVNYQLPPGMAISSQAPKTVKFTIKGPRVFVRNIQKREDILVAGIDKIYDKKKKSYRFDVKSMGLEFPFGVEVTEIEPKNIDVMVDTMVQKSVPVVIQTIGELPVGHEMYEKSFDPSTIKISGAKSVVKEISFVHTLPVDLSLLEGRGEKELGFEVRDKRIESSTKSGILNYEVRPRRSNLLISDVPITFMTTGLLKNVSRRIVNLMVLAKGNAANEIDPKKVRVIAEIIPSATGRVVIELKATLPQGYELVEIIPNKIIATVK